GGAVAWVILGAFHGLRERTRSACDDRPHLGRGGPKRGGTFGRVQRAQPAAGAGAHVDEPSSADERPGGHTRHFGGGAQCASDRPERAQILPVKPANHLVDAEPIQLLGARKKLLGGREAAAARWGGQPVGPAWGQ